SARSGSADPLHLQTPPASQRVTWPRARSASGNSSSNRLSVCQNTKKDSFKTRKQVSAHRVRSDIASVATTQHACWSRSGRGSKGPRNVRTADKDRSTQRL